MSEQVACRVGDYFIRQLNERPTDVALIETDHDGQQPYSWCELATLAARALRAIEAHALPRGAHVATWLGNSAAWVAVDLATQLGGFVHVALDARLPETSALCLARHSSTSLLFTTQKSAQSLRQLIGAGEHLSITCLNVDSPYDASDGRRLIHFARHPQPEALAQILYTSGTMSEPKGVMLSHRNLVSNALAKLGAAPQFADDVRLNVLPFAHAYARTCELSAWIITGSQMIIAHDWANALRVAPRVRPTLLNLVPHLAHKLVAALDAEIQQIGNDEGLADRTACRRAGATLLGDRLRLLQVGGAALRADVWNRLASAGWPPVQGYGLTETSPVICSNRAGGQRPGTVGPPVQDVEVRIDERGVLWTRGPHVMLGYWQLPAATAAKIRDGWLCTDDVAEVTPDGHWRILGRIDDQITLSTGYKAAPYELTQRLANDDWVDQLVIVGQDRPYLAALVLPRVSALPDELFTVDRHPGPLRDMAHINERLFERMLVERWSQSQAGLPRQLRIERVGLLRQPLTCEGGGLNFKGAVRRKVAEEQLLTAEIAQLYRSQ